MTAMNRQVLLASRPQGAVTEDNFRIVDAPIGEPGAGEVLVKNEWLSLDPYMRGRMNDVEIVRPAGADRRSHGRPDGRRGRRVARRALRSRRQRAVAVGLATLRRRPRGRPAQDRRHARAGIVLPRRARHAGDDRVVRAVRHRRAQARRNGRRVGRVGRRGQRGRPAREDPWLPCGGHCRRQGQVRLRRAGARFRRVRRLQARGASRRSARGLPQRRRRAFRERRRRGAGHDAVA